MQEAKNNTEEKQALQTPLLSISIENTINPKEPQLPIPHRKTRIALSLAALLFGSGADMSQFHIGVVDIPGKILGFIENTEAINWIMTAIYFLQSLSINKNFTKQGIDKIFKLYSATYDKNEWIALSDKKLRQAHLLTFLICSYAIFSDSVTNTNFFAQLGLTKTIAIPIGILGGISAIPTESLEIHIHIRKLLANQSKPKTDLSALSCPKRFLETFYNSLKFMLKFFGGIQDGVASYASVTTIFQMTSPSAKWAFLVLSSANGVADFCFGGKNSSYALDQLREKLAQGMPKLGETALFLFTLFAAGLIAHAQYGLTYGLLTTPDGTLPFPLPPQLPEVINQIICIGTAAQAGINCSYYISHFSKQIVNYLAEGFSAMYDYFSHCCKKPEPIPSRQPTNRTHTWPSFFSEPKTPAASIPLLETTKRNSPQP